MDDGKHIGTHLIDGDVHGDFARALPPTFHFFSC